jgi:hypothetical protein
VNWIRRVRRLAALLRAWRIALYRNRENRSRAVTGRISIEAVRKACARHDERAARLDAPPSQQPVRIERWKKRGA